MAYCALRDPVATIYELFPEADNYRTVVRTVDRNTRKAVQELTQLKLHFNELGRHSLYIAQRGDAVLGYVHARSELGEWGLIELAWGIETDETIRGVKVQRARDPGLLEPGAMDAHRPALLGKNLTQLQSGLTDPALSSHRPHAAHLRG